MIFSRRRGGAKPEAQAADEGLAVANPRSRGGKAADDDADAAPARTEGRGEGKPKSAVTARRKAAGVPGGAGAAGTAKARRRPAARGGAGTTGPYDSVDAPDGVERLDLGALQIPVAEGVEVRVQADQEGHVQQVVLVSGDSALQLGVFAAPRTEQVWDEAREGLREQLRADGFTSHDVDGEYGVELRAKVRSPEGVVDLRFVGINGPRWLVRGVYQGAAATDPVKAGPLAECLRGLVVVRGGQAMPAFEALPLKLPREVTEQAQRQDGDGAPDGGGERT